MRILSFALASLLSASTVFAQSFAIPTHVVAGGGGASSGGAYTLAGTIGQPDAGNSMSGGPYRATGGFWEALFGVTHFIDDPIMPGVTVVRAVHVFELRDRINAQRIRLGLPAEVWPHPVLGVGATIVTGQHVQQLRDALVQAYQAAGIPPPSFTDTLVPGLTRIRAVHVSELRAAVHVLEAQ